MAKAYASRLKPADGKRICFHHLKVVASNSRPAFGLEHQIQDTRVVVSLSCYRVSFSDDRFPLYLPSD
jgi:hypothetical protein